MKHITHNKLKKLILIGLLGLVPLGCEAFFLEEMFEGWEVFFQTGTSTADIVNEVRVSANTGNNVINGEIKEGENESHVEIKNIVNGQRIEPLEIDKEASEVKVKEEIEVEDNKALVQREIEIDSEKTTDNYEVDLKEQDEEPEELETENPEDDSDEEKQESQSFEGWWLSFGASLKNWFQNIFNIF